MATIDKKNTGRNFEVIKGTVGPFPQGHIFSEYEFRRLHPAPKHLPGDETVDVESYHAAALHRLIVELGVVKVADKEKQPEPTPSGPLSEPPKEPPTIRTDADRIIEAINAKTPAEPAKK